MTRVIETGTAQGGSANTLQLKALASAVDDAYNGMAVALTGGTGSGQSGTISDYVGATRTASVTVPWGTSPDGTTEYEITGETLGVEWELQRAMLVALEAASLGAAVYDHVPQPDDAGDGAAFPYIAIGDMTDAEFDTDDFYGRELTVIVHSWSRYRGMKELKVLMDKVRAALHNQHLTVVGEHTVLCLWEFSENFTEPDGLTRHGVQRFRFLLTQQIS